MAHESFENPDVARLMNERFVNIKVDLTGRNRYRDRAEDVFRMYGAAAAKNSFGFAHLLPAQDFAQRGPLEIILAGDKLGAAALVESVHRAYLPTRGLAFAQDVPIGEGRHPGRRPARGLGVPESHV